MKLKLKDIPIQYLPHVGIPKRLSPIGRPQMNFEVAE